MLVQMIESEEELRDRYNASLAFNLKLSNFKFNFRNAMDGTNQRFLNASKRFYGTNSSLCWMGTSPLTKNAPSCYPTSQSLGIMHTAQPTRARRESTIKLKVHFLLKRLLYVHILVFCIKDLDVL
jgi:hypothetical protein